MVHDLQNSIEDTTKFVDTRSQLAVSGYYSIYWYETTIFQSWIPLILRVRDIYSLVVYITNFKLEYWIHAWISLNETIGDHWVTSESYINLNDTGSLLFNWRHHCFETFSNNVLLFQMVPFIHFHDQFCPSVDPYYVNGRDLLSSIVNTAEKNWSGHPNKDGNKVCVQNRHNTALAIGVDASNAQIQKKK